MGAKIRAAIVGSTGYGGVELIRLLQAHPYTEVSSVISSSSAGSPIADGYPHLSEIMIGLLDDVDPKAMKEKADVVFVAAPPGVAGRLVPQLLEEGLSVIDLSGDFRLPQPGVYEQWYGKPAADSAYLEQAVFGLAEIYGEQVYGARLISNPGCYPTATLLGIVPAIRAGWIKPETLIIDAKSGVSGAGRGASLGTHYSELNENLKAYKINKHQHIPEIERVLSDAAGREIVTTFTTHLVPMTRGIMTTMYASLAEDRSQQEFIELYQQFYGGRQFVRIRPEGVWPATKEVMGSNYCDIGFSVDVRTKRLTVVSVIDNLVKGAAGQAIQNLNLMMGWGEDTGLQFIPMYP